MREVGERKEERKVETVTNKGKGRGEKGKKR
jgi:hypothetical protein